MKIYKKVSNKKIIPQIKLDYCFDKESTFPQSYSPQEDHLIFYFPQFFEDLEILYFNKYDEKILNSFENKLAGYSQDMQDIDFEIVSISNDERDDLKDYSHVACIFPQTNSLNLEIIESNKEKIGMYVNKYSLIIFDSRLKIINNILTNIKFGINLSITDKELTTLI